MTGTLTDLVEEVDGRLRVPERVHHLPELLELSAEEVLARFLRTQERDFATIIADVERKDAPLRQVFEGLRDLGGSGSAFAETPLFREGGLHALFQDLHGHVMGHPVWRHPFFVRFFEGRFDAAQMHRFAVHYFNQVKNTRQCVAMAIGRFNGLAALPYGVVSQPVSELTQVVLAQLIADEYGVGTSPVENYPPLEALFRSTTHITLYRRMLDAIGVDRAVQDVPMLPEVADNVATQRLVAGGHAFTPLEALASVGLGMEWGVPEFFSLLLGGMIRHAWRERLEVTADDLDIFIAHVKYDVLHAVAVMAVTALHMRSDADTAIVKNAVNMLMSARYGMMSGLYREVFGETCPGPREIGLDRRYAITDRRIEDALKGMRRRTDAGCVRGQEAWAGTATVPFVFIDEI